MVFRFFNILNLLQFYSWPEVSERWNFGATAQWRAGEQRKGAGLRLLPTFSLFFSPIISHPCVPLTVQFLRLTGLLPWWFVISFPTPYCFNFPSQTFAYCPLCPAARCPLPAFSFPWYLQLRSARATAVGCWEIRTRPCVGVQTILGSVGALRRTSWLEMKGLIVECIHTPSHIPNWGVMTSGLRLDSKPHLKGFLGHCENSGWDAGTEPSQSPSCCLPSCDQAWGKTGEIHFRALLETPICPIAKS